MLADELQEARQRLEKGQGPVPQDGPVKAPPPPAGDGVAEALNAVAARIEKICQTI
jgi:cell division protein ZapA